jgi:ribosomal protein S18 acetylase RimI-like enzyme
MDGASGMEIRPATEKERAELLAFMRDDLADDADVIMQFLGITWPEFEQLYRSRGEVRTITANGESAGYCWIEHRGRELHLHAIFVLPSHRGRGIGSATFQALEKEYGAKADMFELGVRESNKGAIALYRRVGFAVSSKLAEVGFLVMRKQIGSGPDPSK